MAADDELVKPYTPMRVTRTGAGAEISVLGRTMTVGANGLPTQVRSFFTDGNTRIGTAAREVLTAPIALVVNDSAGRTLAFGGAASRVLAQSPAR